MLTVTGITVLTITSLTITGITVLTVTRITVLLLLILETCRKISVNLGPRSPTCNDYAIQSKVESV